MDDLESFIEEEERVRRLLLEKESIKQRSKENLEEDGKKKENPYGPYIKIKEHLDEKYFPKYVLGFAQQQIGEAFVNPNVYGPFRAIVKLYEQLHLLYKHVSEAGIRTMTNYLSVARGYV